MSVSDLEELFPRHDYAELEIILKEVNFNLEEAANKIVNKIVQDLDHELCKNISDIDQEKEILRKFDKSTKNISKQIHDKFYAMKKRLGIHRSQKSLKELTAPLVLDDLYVLHTD